MSRFWRLKADRSALYSRGAVDLPYAVTPPETKVGSVRRIRGKSIFLPPDPDPGDGPMWSDSFQPWMPAAGASLYEGMTTAATLVYAHDYTNSRDIYVVLNTVDKISSPTGPLYVQLDEGDYYVNNLRNYGTTSNPNWIAYPNSNGRICGLVGAGWNPVRLDDVGESMTVRGAFLTRIIWTPTVVSSSPGCREYVLAKNGNGPVAVTGLYISGNNPAAAPHFISGISFDGQLQTPYGVYTGINFARNNGVSAPLAYKGLSFWRGKPGSLFQYCRVRGAGFALNSAPPFECGMVDSNYMRMVSRGLELDGRVAAYLDSARPRSGGGYMYNKELDVWMPKHNMHHTRRSGMATNTNTHSTTETYRFTDFQATDIANITSSDPWPSDAGALPGGFNSWNIEEVVGTFTIENGFANSEHSHINWAVPYTTGGVVNTLPNRVVIKVTGFGTDDTSYGGCLRMATPKNPNSSGIAPIWTEMNANFAAACAKYFDIRRADGTALAPVKASQFNSSLHGPSTHYVLRTF